MVTVVLVGDLHIFGTREGDENACNMQTNMHALAGIDNMHIYIYQYLFICLFIYVCMYVFIQQ
jgi:hypothetical protein